MNKYTIVGIKRILTETSIEAENQIEALAKAKTLSSNQFTDLENETAWQVTGAYQNNEINNLK